ncbi:MAG: pseudouridine synthase [Spirochaetes bacterium GWF1_51_8]|nr:MAG: pseudouridine synthase [Spirochaetes bacterium GWF1_51_8]
MKTITLKPGKDRSVRQRHPWLFSGAIAKAEPGIEQGGMVTVADSRGGFLAYGYYNPRSKIALRLLEWDESRTVDGEWWREKIAGAAARREHLFQSAATSAFRLVFGEADLLPGLVADYFDGYIVAQFLTAGAFRMKAEVVEILRSLFSPKGIYSRPEPELLALEGMHDAPEVLYGELPPEDWSVAENGIRYYADLRAGQKTGFYTDQRNNRKRVAEYARGKKVLDCFCYSGGFTLGCLANGALSVTSADSSTDALALLKRNVGLNGFDGGRVRTVEADIFQLLRDYRDNGEKFDLVILDPPKLAPTKASLERAMRAYKDLNLHGIKALEKGGVLATFSCSGGVTMKDFRTALAWAATDANAELQIVEFLSQGEDHPIRVSYPESEYLKGIIARRVN